MGIFSYRYMLKVLIHNGLSPTAKVLFHGNSGTDPVVAT